MIDFFQADFHRLLIKCCFFAPLTHINVYEPQPAPFTPVLQFREDALDQIIPLGLHIAEGAADEDIDFFPTNWGAKFSHSISYPEADALGDIAETQHKGENLPESRFPHILFFQKEPAKNSCGGEKSDDIEQPFPPYILRFTNSIAMRFTNSTAAGTSNRTMFQVL